MIHDEKAAQNSGGAPGFARLARVAHPPLFVSLLNVVPDSDVGEIFGRQI